MDTKTIGMELRKFFKDKGLTQREVASMLGVPYQYINAVLTGKKGIGRENAKRFGNLFGLSQSWLLTGEGEMFVIDKDEQSGKEATPVFDIDFNGGFVERFNDTALEKVGSIDMPTYSKATAVVSVTGDSMHPLISSGDQIILREMPCVMDSILYGGIYAVVTDNDLRTVKRIRRAAEPGCVDLEPINKDVADTTTIKFDRIVGLWRVMGCIKSLM